MEISKGRPPCWKGAHVWFLTAGVGTFVLAVFVLQSSSSSHLSGVLSLSSSDSLRSILAELAELKEEQQYQQAQVRSLRAMLGTVSCKVQNVGPTGGFCLSVENPADTPGVNAVDERYAEVLGELFWGKSVVDVGTGLGRYGKWFEEHAATVAWEGIDGAENIEEVTQGWVKFGDFTERLRLPQRDWVMSIEVGEHLPRQYEGVFVDNLCGLAKVGVVVSWARPNQGGFAHVNEKSFDDVRDMFMLRGMTPDESAGQRLREAASVPWLATNTQVFRWAQRRD